LVRFHVLTTASMNMTVFWDAVLCSPVEVCRRFRGGCYLHHQGALTMLRNIPENRHLHSKTTPIAWNTIFIENYGTITLQKQWEASDNTSIEDWMTLIVLTITTWKHLLPHNLYPAAFFFERYNSTSGLPSGLPSGLWTQGWMETPLLVRKDYNLQNIHDKGKLSSDQICNR
jgi:hypothetical protein